MMQQELSQFPPPLSREQTAARRRQDELIDARFPGEHVAYVDEWHGESLFRRIVAHAKGAIEFQNLLAALPPTVMKRVQLTLVPEADAIPVPSCQIG